MSEASLFNGATLLAVIPEWSLTMSLIFAGCCSNALYLERATRIQPACGTLMTFLQFAFTSIQMLTTQLEFRNEHTGKRHLIPRIRTPKVPLTRWSLQVAMYFGTTLLNNTAFSFHVPVPVHIIFRSGGLVVSMLAGYLIKGRRYSSLQIFSVILVTMGVIIATLATSPDNDASSSGTEGPSTTTYFAGIALLAAALVLSALMGLYQEDTFARYGKEHWQEGLFYNHFLSMPLFALRGKTLRNEWHMALNDKQMWIGWGIPSARQQSSAAGHNALFARTKTASPTTFDVLRLAPSAIYDVRQTALKLFANTPISRLPIWSSSASSYGILVPILMPALTMNVLTQLICVNGVNRLTAMCSSLTVTLVLVVRKAVSLAISVLIIAPHMGEEVRGKAMLFVGASIVLLGTLGYTMGTAATSSSSSTEKGREKQDIHLDRQTGDQQFKQSNIGKSSALEQTLNGHLTRR